MISDAQMKAQSRYDKTHTRQILFKLNRTTDADVLAKLEDVENRQGCKTIVLEERQDGKKGEI